MTNFSTNQVMQFYVLDGTAKLQTPVVGDYCKVEFKDAEGNVTAVSDKIENVMYGKLTKAAALVLPSKWSKITFKADVNGGAPIAGEDYIVRVSYPEIGGAGIEAWTVKTATARGTTIEEVCGTLADNLNKAFEADGVLAAEGDEEGLVIYPTDNNTKAYKRGLRPVKVTDFTVNTATVVLNGEDVDWAEVVYGVDYPIPSGYRVADMEYFAMGERGDQYRYVDYVNAIDTEYKVDPRAEYDVLTIHYAYKGFNQNSHKSEKDIIIAAPVAKANDLKTLATAIEAATKANFTTVTNRGAKEIALA